MTWDTERRIYIRNRWMGWLAAHQPPLNITQLALKLAQEGTDKDSQPRSMVYGWVRGKSVPQPASAWRVGTMLQALEYFDGGPISLYAAGYYAQTIAVLANLLKSTQRSKTNQGVRVDPSGVVWLSPAHNLGREKEKRGMEAAAVLACALPIAVDVAIARALAAKVGALGVLKKTARFEDLANVALQLCAQTCRPLSSLLLDMWPTSAKIGPKLPSDADDVIRVAHAAASAHVHPAHAMELSWQYVVDWAARSHDGHPVWSKFHKLWDVYQNEWRSEAHAAVAADHLYYQRLGVDSKLLKHPKAAIS